MSWRSTEYEDLHRINSPDTPAVGSLWPDTAATREVLHDNARTWWEGDNILAIVGVAPMWKGVGQVWTALTPESRERGVALTRGVLRFLDMLHAERGYWRVQATAEQADSAAQHWILQLGFDFEGTMEAYGPDGKTHDLYARVRR